jgi:hypothetical protein
MDNCLVGNGHVAANDSGRFLVGGMDNRIILYVGVVSDSDGMNIPPDHSAIPYTAMVTYHDITNDYGGFGEKCLRTDLRDFTRQGPDQCHILLFLSFCKYRKSPKYNLCQ